MWQKPDDSKPKSLSGAIPAPAPSSPHPGSSASQYAPLAPAAVGYGIKIKGEISGHGDFFFDGEFEGMVRLAGGTFTVGSNARVNAEIEAREVIIRGEVVGSLKCCERVHIWSTGKLTGNMETRGIVIEDGAVLHSKVATPQSAAREVGPPEPSASHADQPQPSNSESQVKGASA